MIPIIGAQSLLFTERILYHVSHLLQSETDNKVSPEETALLRETL